MPPNHDSATNNPEVNSAAAAASSHRCQHHAKCSCNAVFRHRDLGDMALEAGQYAVALKHYATAKERLVSHADDDPGALQWSLHAREAAVYRQIANWPAVVERCTAVLKHDPSGGADDTTPPTKQLWLYRAEAYRNLGARIASLVDAWTFCALSGRTFEQAADRNHELLREIGEHEADRLLSVRVPLPYVLSPAQVNAYLDSFLYDPLLDVPLLGEHAITLARLQQSQTVGFPAARHNMQRREYASCVAACTEELQLQQLGDHRRPALFAPAARLLRGTLALLSVRHELAAADFESVSDDAAAPPAMRANALCKWASGVVLKQEAYAIGGRMPTVPRRTALALFERALALDARNPDVFLQRGRAYMKCESYEEALRNFERAVELRPRAAQPAMLRAMARYRLAAGGRQKRKPIRAALDALRALCERFPENPDVFCALSEACEDQGRAAEALYAYGRALAVADALQTPLIYVRYGALMMAALVPKTADGKATGPFADEARVMVRQAAQLDPCNAYVQEQCAMIELTVPTVNSHAEAIYGIKLAILFARKRSDLIHLCAMQAALIADLMARRYKQAVHLRAIERTKEKKNATEEERIQDDAINES